MNSPRTGAVNAELAGLRATWAEAERRLYPLATSAPESYMRAVTLVRALADRLGDVHGDDVLVQRWHAREELLAGAVEDQGAVAAPNVAADDVAGAAFALRLHELATEREETDRRQRVTAARDSSQDWAILHERGDVARGLGDPYQCLEFHLASQLTVVSTVEQDPSTGGVNHVVSVVRFDHDGVHVEDTQPEGFADVETASADEFGRARDEAKRLVAEQR